jgi:hypothetical protein
MVLFESCTPLRSSREVAKRLRCCWQGMAGPVIAKRVAEDRSASAEPPPVAEHCILVKQAPGGGAWACNRHFPG